MIYGGIVEMWRFRGWLHKITGFRGWDSPKGYEFRYWLLWVWNEYDDWLFDGIHGFRILGGDFDTQPRWLNWLCWKILPFIRRYVIRRLPRRMIK